MPADDRGFAAGAAAIAKASRSRLDHVRRDLAEQQEAARARGRDLLQRMVDLADRPIQETTTVAERDGVTNRGPAVPGAPTRSRAGAPPGDDESFSDRHWLH